MNENIPRIERLDWTLFKTDYLARNRPVIFTGHDAIGDGGKFRLGFEVLI